jgi:RTX calcium-binding nonapeptide repeat (4 copies)
LNTPVRFGKEFLINTTTNNSQYLPNLTALADGRFIAAWSDQSGIGGDTDTAVRGQIFNADGIKSGTQFLVNTTIDGYQSNPTVTALSDGRFVAMWSSDSPIGGDLYNLAVVGQIFNANGSKSGNEFLVNTTTDNAQVEPALIALSDGRFIAVWTDYSASGGDTSDTAIRAQVFNADGLASGVEFLVNTTTEGRQIGPDVTALADGRFVVTWTISTPGADGTEDVWGQIFEASGAESGGEFLVNTTTFLAQEGTRLTTLADGRFIAIWQSLNLDTGQDVLGQIFNADGTNSGGEFLVSTEDFGDQINPEVVTLADGRFVAVWQSRTGRIGDNSDANIRGQVFNIDGTKSGSEFFVNNKTAGAQSNPSIVVLADGRLVVGWTDDGDPEHNPNASYDVHGQIFDPRTAAVTLTGTALNDQYVGTRFADRLSGGEGNDRLSGANGNDRINGEMGNDRLTGGAGKDVLSGGSGGDAFIFTSTAQANGDRITDFSHKLDDINLHGFMKGGDFIGARAFTGHDDEVRYVKAHGLLQGDVNGDGKADWSLTITNKVALTETDFIF